ncbi:intradiol ring-cleavage dioxygenase [Limnohabitans sp. Rim8]|uniref:intradiol ring-cleavage dioxygenase n=1 Tax=Limnohabitans sp. Rim8 TaxID=1100718 RepID=UPI0025EDF20A|nr:intradiol ring-cleavage dioxygenase [Limnohabitans sp. Rim8]
MENLNANPITESVLERLANTPDPRLKEIMLSLVRHLHGFAREVKLTEAEWLKGIEFLTRTGHITNAQRQEFILLSDVLGLSMLTVVMNNDKPDVCTQATVLGPFHVEDAPHYKLGDDVANGAKGQPCQVQGSVKGVQGEAVAHARIEVWQSDEKGLYDVQYADRSQHQARGILTADAQGRFHFQSILAMPYPIPHDGPVGQLLEATARHPWRPAHLHFKIDAPGYETLITHVFRKDDPYLASDAVFGVRESLVTDWRQLADGTYQLDFDFVLNPV